MMRSRSLRWIALLAAVVVLLPGCDGSDDAAADTTLAATTTTAAPTTTVAAAALSVDHPEGTTITVSLDAVEGLGGHVVSAWVLPVGLNEDQDAIGGTEFWNITDDPFSDSKKLQPQYEARYSEVPVGDSPIVEPGTYRFIIEAYVPSGPMHYGCEMPIEVVEGGPLVVTVSSLPTYTGDGFAWIPPEQLKYPDCPVETFDFSTQSLCDWFSPEEIDTIVARAYEDNDASPIPPPFEEGASSSDSRYPDCWWHSGDISTVGLAAIEPGPFYDYDTDGPIDERWHPHPALSKDVYVDQEVVVGSHDDYVPGVELRLLIEGQEHAMEYWHRVPPGFDDDADAVLAIADEMLRSMGWVPVPGD